MKYNTDFDYLYITGNFSVEMFVLDMFGPSAEGEQLSNSNRS
jgi:hypothetical protein